LQMTGTLNLRAIRAELVGESHKISPYCVFILGDQEAQSDVDKKSGRHPKWNELFHFDLTGNELIFVVKVYKEKHFSKDHLIGEGSVDLSQLIGLEKSEVWVPLNHNSETIGKILVQTEFVTSNGANPHIDMEQKKSMLDIYKKKIVEAYGLHKDKLTKKYHSDESSNLLDKILDMLDGHKDSKDIKEETKVNVRTVTAGLDQGTTTQPTIVAHKVTDDLMIPLTNVAPVKGLPINPDGTVHVSTKKT